MKKMKLLSLNYQRNGISGEGFFHAIVQNLSDNKGKFLISFTTDEKQSETVNCSTCRVVMLDGYEHPEYACWRGDVIAEEIQNCIETIRGKHNLHSFFDVSTLMKNKDTKTKLPLYYRDSPTINK